MDEGQKTTAYQQHNERFVSVLKELTSIKEIYVVQQLHWYKEHATKARRYFRLSSVLIIIFSVSIPFLATPTLEGIWKTIVLPVVALLIAALTGLSLSFGGRVVGKDIFMPSLRLSICLGCGN